MKKEEKKGRKGEIDKNRKKEPVIQTCKLLSVVKAHRCFSAGRIALSAGFWETTGSLLQPSSAIRPAEAKDSTARAGQMDGQAERRTDGQQREPQAEQSADTSSGDPTWLDTALRSQSSGQSLGGSRGGHSPSGTRGRGRGREETLTGAQAESQRWEHSWT